MLSSHGAMPSIASSGIGGSDFTGIATKGRDGGALGGGGHEGGATPWAAAGAFGSGKCKAGGKEPKDTVSTGAGATGLSVMKDHGEQMDSQPHGAWQRTLAAYAHG